MASNENRRRKKIEAKRSKRKDQQRAVARIESSGIAGRTLAARTWPVFDSQVSSAIDENGIGYATIARRGPHGQVVGVHFLLDLYCLGVKDVALHLGSESDWKKRMTYVQGKGTKFDVKSPEAVRKLVDGAVAYAESYGIAPCRDWAHAAPIFGDIDASLCQTEFAYGRNGKPTFIAGPYDSPARIQKILKTLSEKAGEGNYDFTVPINADNPDLESFGNPNGEEEDDDEVQSEAFDRISDHS